MLKSCKHIASLLIAACLITACSAPAPVRYPPISFAKHSPIHLNVLDINIKNEYQSPQRPPNVEHLFPVMPEQAITAWVNDRIKPVGGNNKLIVTIQNASVTQQALPTQGGIKGIFTDEQEAEITGDISVELRVYGGAALSLASTEVHATRRATIPQSASVTQRDQIYYRLTKQMMQDLNAELEKNIQQYLSNHIHYSY